MQSRLSPEEFKHLLYSIADGSIRDVSEPEFSTPHMTQAYEIVVRLLTSEIATTILLPATSLASFAIAVRDGNGTESDLETKRSELCEQLERLPEFQEPDADVHALLLTHALCTLVGKPEEMAIVSN